MNEHLISNLNLYQQSIMVMAALVLFTSFALLAQTRILSLIRVFAFQGILLAATAALVAFETRQHHLYISALLTLVLKGWYIPWMLNRFVHRLNVRRVTESAVNPSLLLLFAAALVVFSYWVALPVAHLSTLITRHTIAVSLAVVLLAMLLIISRRKAISQVVGFMSMENGLFFAALVSTLGMPMVVELGVAFDVLVAAILFGVFFFQIRAAIDSLDVDQLNRLREADE
jgi:hydrogenase-4 component E